MTNHFFQQLQRWYPRRDKQQWVLATLFKIEGPSYRSPGAMMLFNDLGEQFGLLSGGCLEADIQIKAAKVIASGTPTTIRYDASDEDDMVFLLGIGCGGVIHIMLQPLSRETNYLDLPELLKALEKRKTSYYLQGIPQLNGPAKAQYLEKGSEHLQNFEERLNKSSAICIQIDDEDYLLTQIKPPAHILIVGGGVDARPLAEMAVALCWEVTLCDPRPANGRRENFMTVNEILRCEPNDLSDEPLFQHFDAAIVMTHNLRLDADAIAVLQNSNVRYLGLLGPITRKQRVLSLAKLSEDKLRISISGPAGLRLGGELPEEIALSILAECQSTMNSTKAIALSNGK